jgi:hypothetical protein
MRAGRTMTIGEGCIEAGNTRLLDFCKIFILISIKNRNLKSWFGHGEYRVGGRQGVTVCMHVGPLVNQMP